MTLFRDHLEHFGTGPDGRIFTGPRGGIVAEWSYLEIFHTARREALGETQAATPLMGRPYDLRHAAGSTWLNAGVPAAQVAEWAGHSVDVLLRVYVKCIAGQQGEAKRRIEDAMRPDGDISPGDREPHPDPEAEYPPTHLPAGELGHVFGTASRIGLPEVAYSRTLPKPQVRGLDSTSCQARE